ncbi:MAG: glycosyl hydrolase family 5 [Rhodobacteraceae bacterium]|nr:glycosyl hydrolase family 5 [Paracoccaceae bacterium]
MAPRHRLVRLGRPVAAAGPAGTDPSKQYPRHHRQLFLGSPADLRACRPRLRGPCRGNRGRWPAADPGAREVTTPAIINRRGALGLLGGAALTGLGARDAAARPEDLNEYWQVWISQHFDPAGRVIDDLQDGVSHSEGQGYGMLLAVALGDRDRFEAMAAWTRKTLAIRENDALHAWRWDPANGGKVEDMNNASDGDLFIAWALTSAADTWNAPEHATAARAIAADLDRLCLYEFPDRPGWPVLLPGVDGFRFDDRVVLNTAYPMPRALDALAARYGLPHLASCARMSSAILDALCEDSLPPDWIEVGQNGIRAASDRPAVFGYEAMRAPLFDIWSGRFNSSAVLQAARLYREALLSQRASGAAKTPVVTNVDSWKIIETSAAPGYHALASLSLCASGTPSTLGSEPVAMPDFQVAQAYYPSTLHLLALVAAAETKLECRL